MIISASLPSMHEPKMVHLPNAPFKFKLGYQYLRGLYCEVPHLCLIYYVYCTCQMVMSLDAFCNVMLHIPFRYPLSPQQYQCDKLTGHFFCLQYGHLHIQATSLQPI